MERNYCRLVLLTIMLVPLFGSAQSDSSNTNSEIHLKIGAFYNTHLHYYGRTDSLRSSGFFPLAEIGFGDHFYVNAAPVFVSNKATPFEYAGTVATAGYRFNSENKFAGNIFFVKPFYRDNSQLVESALKGQAAATLSWLGKAINLTIGGDVKFSDNTDYGATAGIDHAIRLEPDAKSVLVIDPSFYAFAGTQQFTKTYYRKSSFLIFPGVEQSVTENVNSFKILSYELSVPVVYGRGKWQLLLIPAYVMPQHLITVENRPDLSERGRNMFYATLGAKVSI